MRHDMPLGRRRLIREGQTKILYEGPDAGSLILYFKDSTSMFKRPKNASENSAAVINGKGAMSNNISAFIHERLAQLGISTHFIKRLNTREQQVRVAEVIPLEVVVRNRAAGAFAERLGLEEGSQFDRPLIEWRYKKSTEERPLVSEDHIISFGWATTHELEDIIAMTTRTNDLLSGLFAGIGFSLIDVRLSFGRIVGEDDSLTIALINDISPECCRLWGLKSDDRYEEQEADQQQPLDIYQLIARRLNVLPEESLTSERGNVTPMLRDTKR